MIIPKRITARMNQSFCVFLIGMRINRAWKLAKWLPVFFAMPRMLDELRRRPELGFLGGHLWFGRTTLVLQYWQSFEALTSYASQADLAHLPAWGRGRLVAKPRKTFCRSAGGQARRKNRNGSHGGHGVASKTGLKTGIKRFIKG